MEMEKDIELEKFIHPKGTDLAWAEERLASPERWAYCLLCGESNPEPMSLLAIKKIGTERQKAELNAILRMEYYHRKIVEDERALGERTKDYKAVRAANDKSKEDFVQTVDDCNRTRREFWADYREDKYWR